MIETRSLQNIAHTQQLKGVNLLSAILPTGILYFVIQNLLIGFDIKRQYGGF